MLVSTWELYSLYLWQTDLKEGNSRAEGVTEGSDDTDSTSASDTEDDGNSNECLNSPPEETLYTENESDIVTKGAGGGGDLSEEFADENKNIIWCLMKQVCSCCVSACSWRILM